MLPSLPFTKLVDILPDVLVVCVEQVRAILIHEDSKLIAEVVTVATDVWSLVDDEGSLAAARRQLLGNDCPRKSTSDDQKVIVVILRPLL